MMLERGAIYFVDLNPVRGREQRGLRPVLIVSNNVLNRLPLVVTVVVGTDGANIGKDFPTNVRVPAHESGLPLDTVFMCFQIRSLDASRFPETPAGRLGDERMKQIDNALRYVLDLG